MKKAISVALFTVLFIAVCAGALFGYFKYNQTDFSFADGTKSGTLEISRYNGDAVNIEIPSSYHGKKVAYISKEAFRGSDIESVTFPDSIVSIGESAFNECEKLSSVKFGKGLEYLGMFAFRGCVKLESVEFSSELKSFDASAFLDCENLKEIKLGDKAEFTDVNGVIFSKDQTTAVWSPADKDLASFDYPQSVKKYGAFFFYGHDEITSFDFPDGTEAVERGVLAECKNLAKVTLPQSVKRIDHSAFYDCKSLKTINLPEAISSIGDSVFSCDGIKNLDTVLTVKKDTYAYNYAVQNKLNYELA